MKSGQFTRPWGDFRLGDYHLLTNNCIKFVNSVLELTMMTFLIAYMHLKVTLIGLMAIQQKL